jgi:hypothetical protein
MPGSMIAMPNRNYPGGRPQSVIRVMRVMHKVSVGTTFGGYRYCNKTGNWVELMLIFCILPAVEVHVVTVLAPYVIPPPFAMHCETVPKPCPRNRETMSNRSWCRWSDTDIIGANACLKQ